MAKFKQIPQTFLYRKLLKFWGNMVKNFDGDCRDDDFFDVVRNCFDHDKAVELIEAAYTPAELAEMGKARSRACRLDLSDSLDDVFNALWNNEGSRDKCQAVLEAAREYMEADCKGRGDDIVARRFGELKRVLKLDDLEAEILVFAYVRDQTCFSWPVRVEDREKPMYYAMALDRSYDEVVRAMAPQGKLLKLGLLDNDYDFSRRTLGGFMDGTTKETIERRFYAKSEGKVPRRDQQRRPNRALRGDDPVLAAGFDAVVAVEVQPARAFREPPEEPGPVVHFAARLGQRFAHLQGDQRGDFFASPEQPVMSGTQDVGPPLRCHARPVGGSVDGVIQRVGRVGRSRVGDPAKHRFVGGVDHLEGRPAARRPPPATDEQFRRRRGQRRRAIDLGHPRSSRIGNPSKPVPHSCPGSCIHCIQLPCLLTTPCVPAPGGTRTTSPRNCAPRSSTGSSRRGTGWCTKNSPTGSG